MTSTTSPTRLRLTPRTSLAGLLDGAWWPYSRDLGTELPPLVEALEERWGRITRITANPGPWPVASSSVSVGGYVVDVDWLTDQDRDTMILISNTLGRCDLLVVPPEAESASAARLMALASAPGNVHTAGSLVSGESATGPREAGGGEDAGRTEAETPTHPVVGARMISLPRNMRR
jgi:hypothetical protein